MDNSPPALRQVVLMDVHPRRAARHVPDAQIPLALSDRSRGIGWVGPFKDENVYVGGLSCVEHTYILPPEVLRQGWEFEVQTTLDGIVIKYSTLRAVIAPSII